jgi:DNA-damage-inducible protein J
MYINRKLMGIAMAETTTTVRVRVDEKIKAQAEETLAEKGLTVSDAVRVFLACIAADKELPFLLKLQAANSRAETAQAGGGAGSRVHFPTDDGTLIDDICGLC